MEESPKSFSSRPNNMRPDPPLPPPPWFETYDTNTPPNRNPNFFRLSTFFDFRLLIVSGQGFAYSFVSENSNVELETTKDRQT